MSDESARLLGARDGLVSALLKVRGQINAIDGRYAPPIHPHHTRKRAQRDAVLRPLREVERQIERMRVDCVNAYADTGADQ
jgi:hypothetical protein